MENASKALIIAGAILLSISIIGIGMFIFSQASDTIKGAGAGLSTEQVATYNSKFDNYVGTQQGSSVRMLCQTIRDHNLANSDDVTRQVAIVEGSAADVTTAPTKAVEASTVNTIRNKIGAGKTYTVDFGYDANSGLIVAVGIQEK